MAACYCYCLGIKSNDFFLKDNKKAFILWLNVPKVTAYNRKDEVSSEANSDGEKSEKSQSGEPNNSSEDRDSSKGTPGTPTPKTIYHGPSRKGRTYNKHTVGTPIIHKCDLSHLPEYFQH